MIAPWVGYNLTRFHHPVYLSSQFEVLLASANCDTTYHGDLLGYFSIPCASAIANRHHLTGDQSDEALVYRRAAIDYVLDHKERVPVVVAARVGRMLGVYRPHQQLVFDEFLDLREKWIARAALYSFYALALLSVAGAIVLRRRRVVLFPLLAAPAAVLITVVVTYANTRFRAPAEVALAVLAAVAIDAAIGWTAQRRGRGQRERADAAPEGGSPPPGTLAKDAAVGADDVGLTPRSAQSADVLGSRSLVAALVELVVGSVGADEAELRAHDLVGFVGSELA